MNWCAGVCVCARTLSLCVIVFFVVDVVVFEYAIFRHLPTYGTLNYKNRIFCSQKYRKSLEERDEINKNNTKDTHIHIIRWDDNERSNVKVPKKRHRDEKDGNEQLSERTKDTSATFAMNDERRGEKKQEIRTHEPY